MEPQDIQERQYSFPYHYLPWEQNGVWRVGRFLWWGFEYLAVLNTVLRMVEKSIQTEGNSTVLDFGCGDGRLIVELLSRFNSSLRCVAGVDISEKALTFARAATLGHPHVRFFSNVPQAAQEIGPFDIAVAMEVLEHISPDDLPKVVEDIHASLAEGGWFVVSVPTTNIPLNLKHYQHFTLVTLTKIFGNKFVLDEYCFVHRVSTLATMIRRAVVNRFFTCNSTAWLRLCTVLYKRFVFQADERTGAHMVCRFRKVGRHG